MLQRMPLGTLALASLLLAAGGRAFADPVPAADLFVAPGGNDAWSGTLAEPKADKSDGPLATLGAARLAVRKFRAARPDRNKPVTVLLRGGTYFLPETVTFTADDAGTAAAPTVYAAYPGESPVLSGGVRVGGWQVGPDGRWRVTLPDVKAGKWAFGQLFVDGQRRMRPRLPKEGYYHVAARVTAPDAKAKDKDDRFRFPADSIRKDWKNLGDVEVVTFHPWFTSHLPIASVDEASNVVTFAGHTRGSEAHNQLRAGMRFLVDNVAEALGDPGTWYLDRPSGELTYVPLPGETPDKSEVIAPRLEKLLVLDGGAGGEKPVTHLEFRGLSFEHAEWVIPKDGYSSGQGAVAVQGAVFARGARDCAFVDCSFTHLGPYGLELEVACQNDRVEGCRFTDLAAGGVKVGSTRVPSKPELATTNITLRDNLIAHGGRRLPAAIGVWVGHADHLDIEHNDIYDFYYTAVSLGWTWGYGPSGAHHNTVAWNHLHTLGQGVLSDMGAIYTLGICPGTTLHHNHIHDVQRVDYGGWGLYYDEGTTGAVSRDNLVYRTQDGGFHQHYGQDNSVVNNIIAFSTTVAYGPTRIDPGGPKPGEPRQGLAFTFERNIVDGWGAPSVIRTEWLANKLTASHPEKFKVDNNVYWNGGKPVEFAGLSFADWQAKGFDAHSVVADPVFLNPDKGDWRLGPDAPARRLGFEPFDVSAAGRLKAEPADLDAGRWPRAFPAPPGPAKVGEDFEHTPVGARADGATTTEENDRATIRVTDEAAHGGRRSLKFVDAPGQKQAFNPHIYWVPHYASGTAVGRLAWRPDGLVLSHEWRTAGGPYKVGPAVYVAADGGVRFRDDRDSAPRLTLPRGKWATFEITCPLGEKAGTYDVTVTPAGGKARRFTGLACQKGFNELSWFGFSAAGTEAGVGYLDDLALELRP